MNAETFKKYNLFIFYYVLLFSLIPIVTRNVLPYDMLENLYWGKEWQLGYSKHPPLFAWISFAFYKVCFSIPESLYILTQLNLLLGLYFVFQITQLIYKDTEKSYAAVFIFMSSACAVFGNEKFNATTILMSLLPAMFYFFLRMIKFRKKTDAVLLGIFSALALVSKYFSPLFMGCMGLFLLINKESRSILKTSLPYIAVIIFLIGISWHLYWIYENNFITIRYALAKSTLAEKNYLSAFHFLTIQFLFFASSFIAAAYALSSSDKSLLAIFRNAGFFEIKKTYSMEEQFIIFITLVPTIILVLISIFTGMRIGSFWGANMMMLLGIFLVVINKKTINLERLYDFTKYIALIFGIILFSKLSFGHISESANPTYIIDYREVSRQIEKDWNTLFFDKKIENIVADKATTALHIYLKDSPSFYDTRNLDTRDLFSKISLGCKNTVVTFVYKKNDELLKKFHDFYENDILFEKSIDIKKDLVLHYAFLKNR